MKLLYGYEVVKPQNIKNNMSIEEIKKVAKSKGYTLQKIDKEPKNKTPKQRVKAAEKKMLGNGEKITVIALSKMALVSRTTARKYRSVQIDTDREKEGLNGNM